MNSGTSVTATCNRTLKPDQMLRGSQRNEAVKVGF